ncbi:MAG: hypothetical protein ACYS99_20085 [Planctomycetota bacterium]|jgi:hypothetical protein
MRVGTRLVLALVLLAPLTLAADGPSAPEPVPVVALRDAAKEGIVAAKGVDPRSYREVTLVLTNRTSRPLEVDICGSHLIPRPRGSCQRLGIGPPITQNVTLSRGRGTVVVKLGPKEKRELRVNTVCLDAGRAGPSRHVFDAADAKLPPVREKVLRWWADHPTAPQSAVNAAIWKFRGKVDLRPGVAPNYRVPSGKYPALHGGTYYRLENGELLSLDGFGIRRFLGTEIFKALPCADGVYAVGLGEARQPELWRLAMTGREPWAKVMDLDTSSRLLDIIPVGKGNLAVVTDQGIGLWNRSERNLVRSLQRQQILDLSVVRTGKGALLVTLKVPASEGYYQDGEKKGEKSDLFELWTVSEATGKADRLKRFWNVKVLLAGMAGVYGISPSGALRRLSGKTFKTMKGSGTYSRILAVGRKVLWLVTAEGRLAAVDARTGSVIENTAIEVEDDFVHHLDKVTDDLAYVRDGKFYRIRAADGVTEEIRGREE